MLGYEHMTPVMYTDGEGNSPVWILFILAVWLLFNFNADDPNTMVNYAESQVNNGVYFRTHQDAANSWKVKGLNGTSTDGNERSAMIFSVNYGGNYYYYYGYMYKGNRKTVINGFLFGYLTETPVRSFLGSGSLVGTMHTHPIGSGTGASNADRFMLYIPRIEHSYIFTAGVNTTYYDRKNPNVDFWEALKRMISNGHGSAR